MKTTHRKKVVNNLLKKEFGLNINHIIKFTDKSEKEIFKVGVDILRFTSRQLLISYGAWLERNNQIISFNHKRLNDFLNERE